MKRWPIIRHIRYWYLSYKVQKKDYCGRYGILVPSKEDSDHLEKVWRGGV